jgi:predicted enzyme related to lactoylglutathione lyase
VADRFKTHGDFSWTELMTRDVEAAKKFYAELLGWSMEEMPMAEGPYIVLRAGDKGVGGMMVMPSNVPAHVPAHWASYVTVDDVDAVAKKAEELGAKTIVPPTDVPGVGRFCTFQDPEGAVLSVMTYSME